MDIETYMVLMNEYRDVNERRKKKYGGIQIKLYG